MDSPAPGAGGGRSSSFEFTLTADELALLEEVESSLGGTSLSSLHDADLVNSVPDDVRAELAALDRLVESYVPGVAAARDVGANDDDDDDDDDDDVEDVSKKDEALSAEKGGTHGAAGEKEASAPRGGTSAGAFVADKLYEMITAKDLEPVALAQAEALSGVASSTERLRAFNAMSRDFLDGSGGTALSARVQEVSDLLARMASVSHRVQNLQRRVHFAQQRQRARQ